jgi:enoyl-CoA hydratase/carnithine racemase
LRDEDRHAVQLATAMYPVRKMNHTSHVGVEKRDRLSIIHLQSEDSTNCPTRAFVVELAITSRNLSLNPRPLIITGNQKFFSAGADLSEIAMLTGSIASEFSQMGQQLMHAIEHFPAPVYAAIHGYCMAGGLDLAWLAVAALGLVTGWGGTQRLPRLVGKARALEIFTAAEKIHAKEALGFGLIDAIADDPPAPAAQSIHRIAKDAIPASPAE